MYKEVHGPLNPKGSLFGYMDPQGYKTPPERPSNGPVRGCLCCEWWPLSEEAQKRGGGAMGFEGLNCSGLDIIVKMIHDNNEKRYQCSYDYKTC